MVFLDMAGRLGNQFFRYSFAKKVQTVYGDSELLINFDRVYSHNQKNQGWDNSLKLFKTNFREVSGKREFYKNATFMQLIIFFAFVLLNKCFSFNKSFQKSFQMKVQSLLNKYDIYYLELGYFEYDFLNHKEHKVKFICGCFECSKYFDDIKENIQYDFQPVEPVDKKNTDLLNKIINTESICITIRRGNFVDDSKIEKKYNICDIDYYNSAIKLINKKVQNPTFFVFSDDIEWAKSNINFEKSNVYFENDETSLKDKVILMSSCKHFIISNSTFSWMVQYLSKNKTKIVVSPSRWYKDNNIKTDLIEGNWLKINV